jgi:hypothetical protein
VQNGVIAALTDPATGLFGAQRLGIGQSVFDSQIAAACQTVAGFVAIEAMLMYREDTGFETSHLHAPPEGAYFDLDPSDLYLPYQVAANG